MGNDTRLVSGTTTVMTLTNEQERVLKILNHAGEPIGVNEPPCEHCDGGRFIGELYEDDTETVASLVGLGLARDAGDEYQTAPGAIFCITETGTKLADERKLWF